MKLLLVALLAAACNAFVVPTPARAVSVAASSTAAAMPLARVAEVTMGARAPVKKPKKAVKKAVKKPVKKVVKKPKKVVKKAIKKPIKKKAAGGSRAMAQRNAVGGGTASVTGLASDLVTTLLTPTQLAWVTLWVACIAKFLIFYEQAP